MKRVPREWNSNENHARYYDQNSTCTFTVTFPHLENRVGSLCLRHSTLETHGETHGVNGFSGTNFGPRSAVGTVRSKCVTQLIQVRVRVDPRETRSYPQLT